MLCSLGTFRGPWVAGLASGRHSPSRPTYPCPPQVKTANLLVTYKDGVRWEGGAGVWWVGVGRGGGGAAPLRAGAWTCLQSPPPSLPQNPLHHPGTHPTPSPMPHPPPPPPPHRPAAGGGAGFRSPLTRLVCTPCYRAPEVVMSRGQYSSVRPGWGLGPLGLDDAESARFSCVRVEGGIAARQRWLCHAASTRR